MGTLPSSALSDGLPAVCSRIRVADEVLELYSVIVRFDSTNDVTLSELRVELIYPANDVADRYFRT